MKPFFITTSIPYPNANPHIGFAMELAQADFLARYYRLSGQEVYFLTGLDEHGLKIQRSAEEKGVTAEEWVGEKSAVFQRLADQLGLSYDRFIRTTDADHVAMAQALWRAAVASGDIYKKTYKAWYNVKEEEFLGLVDEHPDVDSFGIDPRFIEKIEEENYFFRLSRYKDRLLELLNNGLYKVTPANRKQEVINFVLANGLQDISISRERSKLQWGIPVPDDDSQVMYVWFDALTNYLSASATVDGQGIIKISPIWPADLHCVGKDIIRFHALIWPAMLLSANLPIPKELLVHGFVNSGGQKMSKSVGNVIDPFPILERYGADSVRWYLLKEVPTTDDGDFTLEHFKEVYTANLANDYGNLVSRVTKMVQTYQAGKVTSRAKNELGGEISLTYARFQEGVEKRSIQTALQAVHQFIVRCNQYVEESKPWSLNKTGQTELLAEVLADLMGGIRFITGMLQPVMPMITKRVITEVFPNTNLEVWKNFTTILESAVMSEEVIGETSPLFPKYD